MRRNTPTIGGTCVMCITGLMMLVVLAGCGSPDLHCERAQLRLYELNYDAAASEARAAIRQDPKYARAYLLLCSALQGTRDADGALAACRQANSLAPDMPGLHGTLAEAYDGKKDWKSAIPEYRAQISSTEKDIRGGNDIRRIATLHWLIGNDLMKLGDMAGAIAEGVAEARAYDEARARDGGPARRGEMQRLLKRRGLLTTAIANGQELARSKPTDAEAHYQLGSALEADEQLELAAKEYEQACKLGPSENRYCADARLLSEKLQK